MRLVKDSPRATVEVVITHLPPGQLIPGTRYRVLRKIGEGAMGEVYLAEHVDLERKVALKLLNSSFARQAETVERFREEARAASRIGNPYICDVTDFGYTPEGRVFFVMEYLDGKSLRMVLNAEGPIAPIRIIGILRQVCKALGAAHEKGIIHLDVKPDNIMVRDQHRRTDLVKMVDFGIAGLMNRQVHQDTISGTPEYIAPERALGRGYGHRSDIYSLGVTAYEMLTGTPPFHDGDVTKLLHKHVEEDVQSLRERAPERNIPAELDTLVRQMMEKDPDARPQNMAIVEAMLCEVQIALEWTTPWDDLELPAVDEQWRAKLADRMPTPRGRQRKRIAIGALAVAAVAVGVALYMGVFKKPEVEIREVRVEVTNTNEQPSVAELLRKASTAAGALHYVRPAGESALHYLEAAEAEAARLYEDKTSPGAKLLRRAYADALALAGSELLKADLVELAVLKYKDALLFESDDPVLQAKAQLSPDEQKVYSDHSRARPTIRLAAAPKIYAREYSREDEAKAVAGNLYVAASQGRFSEARLSAQKLNNLDPSHVQSAKIADAIRKFGREAWTGGKHSEARSYYALVADLDPQDSEAKERLRSDLVPAASIPSAVLDAITIGRTKKAPDASQDAPRQMAASQPHSAAGMNALAKGRLPEAETSFIKALRLDPMNPVAVGGLAEVAFERARYAEALDYGRTAAKLAPKSSRYLVIVGDAYFKLLRYKEAYDTYMRAQKLSFDDERITSRIGRTKQKLGLGRR